MGWIVAVVVLILDRISKHIAKTYLQPLGSVPVVKNIFHFTYVENRGVAFGMLQNKNWIFIPVTIAIVAVIVYILYSVKQSSLLMKISLMLVLSGALGNLIDRVLQGYVVDFFDFRVWPVFNIADSSIVIGAILLGYVILIKGEGLENG